MAVASSRNIAGVLVSLAALSAASGASAQDSVAGAIFGAGTGAIIGHVLGGPDAAVAGGVVGAVTGAALASSGRRSVLPVHYEGGYGGGYAPPRYHPRHSRGPVYVAPPAVVFVPNRGHGYWHHGFDAWGRPLRTWIPAPAPHRYYAPPPRRHHPGYRGGHHHGGGW